jgi:hypothetical protein
MVAAMPVTPAILVPVLTVLASPAPGLNLAVLHGGLRMPAYEPVERPVRKIVKPTPVAAPIKPTPVPVFKRKQDRN